MEKVNKNNNRLWKSLQEHIRYPGLIIIGIFLFFFSILRFNHWALVNIMLLAGIGLVIIFLGIIWYFKTLTAKTVIGSVLSGVALTIFYSYDRRITDVVAISYSFGIIVLLLDMIGAIKNRQSLLIKIPYELMPKPDITPTDTLEDRYTKTVSSGLQNLQDILVGYKNAIAEEKTKMKASVEEQLLKMLELNDGFESYMDKYKNSEPNPEGFTQIRKMHDDLQETLDAADIHPIEVDIGRETIDEKKHEVIKVINEPPSEFTGKPTITQVKKRGYFVGPPISGKILRRARVEVEWKSDSDAKK